MGYEFDGENRLVTLTTGTLAFEAKDLYSRWKDWVGEGDNAKWVMAMSTVGGEAVTGSETVGQYFFMENGWRIKPQEANHTLEVAGNLLVAGGGIPFINTEGDFNVRIITQFSANTIGVSTEGGTAPTANQVATAVWNKPENELTTGVGKLQIETKQLADDAATLSTT